MADIEREVRELIVEALMLDAIPDDLHDDTDLFDHLGLDSVDALELAMAVRRRYGIEFAADDDGNRAVFTSVATLAAFIRQKIQA